MPGRQYVRHPFAAGAEPALPPHAALRPKFARTITVRQQHRVAFLQQLLGPIAIARLDRLGMAGQSAAAMQRDHDRKRAIAVGLVQLRVQYPVAEGDVDLMRGRQRRRISDKSHRK